MRALTDAFAITLFGILIVVLTLAAVFFSTIIPKTLQHDVTLEFVTPRPGFTYFLMCRKEGYNEVTIEPLALVDGHTARVKNDTAIFYWSRIKPLRLCAVPEDLVKEIRVQEPPKFEWFDTPANKSKLCWSGELGEIPVTVWGFWKPQHTIIRRYRVTHTPAELKVELVEDRVVNSWSDIAVIGGGGLVAFLVLAWVWVWQVRQWRKAYC